MKANNKITFLILLLMTSFSFSQTNEEIEDLKERITKQSEVVKIKTTELSIATSFSIALFLVPMRFPKTKSSLFKGYCNPFVVISLALGNGTKEIVLCLQSFIVIFLSAKK
jgi:hypothetical protein